MDYDFLKEMGILSLMLTTACVTLVASMVMLTHWMGF